jgi:hypothetical protein
MSRYLKVVLVELFILYPALMLMLSSPVLAETERFYVGAAVCRQCHHQPGKQGQFNRWHSSKHAHAYAALAMPESIEIARLSGIDVNPFDSPICLGCHATASETEAWQRDEEFYLEDGIQCEACHGPGSEYIDETIMADRKAAIKAGFMEYSIREGKAVRPLPYRKKFQLQANEKKDTPLGTWNPYRQNQHHYL